MKSTLPLVLISAILLAGCSRTPSAPQAEAQLNKPQNVAKAKDQPCVHLNTATAEQLASLPGVREELAARIVEYRNQHGPFRNSADVMVVEGVSEKKFRKMSAHFCPD
jgi:competence protein ComEA